MFKTEEHILYQYSVDAVYGIEVEVRRTKRPLRYTSFRSFVKVSAIAVNFALATPVPGQLGSVDSIPQLGEVAPDFVLRGATRYGVLQNPVRLSDFRGQTVVLAFFSKAFDKG